MSISDVNIDGRELGLEHDTKIPLADIPPCVFEATLAETRPSYLASLSGKWTQDAITQFTDMTKDILGSIEIYSFWNGVASVVLQSNKGKSINEKLSELQLAEACEESYPSKYDHALRYQTQNFPDHQSNETYQEIDEYLKEFEREPIKVPDEKLCTRNVVLRGPFSPLETTIHSTIRSLSTKTLAIERFSVNSVLLDTDSNDPTDRLIVAASCGSDASGNTLILRNTTVMPNIHGFGAFMAMLFAPMIEIHPDPTRSRFNSILCGLGYNPKKQNGYFEEHDVIIHLDCVVDQEDLLQINKIRSTMSDLLYTNEKEGVPNLTQKFVNERQKTLIVTLLNYLEKPRQLIDIRSHSTIDHEWGLLLPEEMLEVAGTDLYKERAAFPSFTFTGLKEETEREINELDQNNKELHQIAFGYKYMGKEFECRLCSMVLSSVPEAQIHLFRKLHRDRAMHVEKILNKEK